KIGIIGGSGLGDAICAEGAGKPLNVSTPFGNPSNVIIETDWQGVTVALLNRHGAGHLVNPSMVNYRANIYALKAIGCTHIIASGAVGSLREEIRPKDLVIPDQVIDKTYRRAPTFFDDGLVAHVEFASPFCPVLRKHLLGCCSDTIQTKVHDGGTYVCMEGPTFSTRAESEMHRAWGGDLIGMTVMPEAKLAREAEIAYAMVALPSDYDCWRPHPTELDKHELLKEIIGNLTEATKNAIELIKSAVGRFSEIADIPSPAHSALEMAIWSNREMISPDAKKKLGVLVEKYL
ncbi:MAG: S-methyl-5'-thioadenosine phosphorylase, partial [Phycisphaerae bacterium]|nr:S-methyl-5'-thioadenosine phosphorylase [Phycisphaerae bacterium]